MKDLTEHFVSGELVFDGKLLEVHLDQVRLPDGSQGAREYIRHPGAVAVVPLFDDRSVLLERQFRYPHRREFIEVPAGKLEPNEPHLDTAKRELLEETGYTAAEWTRLGVIHTAIAYTDEAIEIFLAKNLKQERAPQLDAGETEAVPDELHLRGVGRQAAIEDQHLAAPGLAPLARFRHLRMAVVVHPDLLARRWLL